MTVVLMKKTICAKCGKESEQMIVCSVNFLLGDKESNKDLMSHKQECPFCHYKAVDISKIQKNRIIHK